MALHIVYTFFYILNGLYYSLISFLPVVFVIYSYALVDDSKNRLMYWKKLSYVIFFLPVIFTIAYIWISPNFSNHEYSIFYIFPGYSIFHFGSIGYLVLYSCGAIYIAGAVGSVHRYRKSLENMILYISLAL